MPFQVCMYRSRTVLVPPGRARLGRRWTNSGRGAPCRYGGPGRYGKAGFRRPQPAVRGRMRAASAGGQRRPPTRLAPGGGAGASHSTRRECRTPFFILDVRLANPYVNCFARQSRLRSVNLQLTQHSPSPLRARRFQRSSAGRLNQPSSQLHERASQGEAVARLSASTRTAAHWNLDCDSRHIQGCRRSSGPVGLAIDEGHPHQA